MMASVALYASTDITVTVDGQAIGFDGQTPILVEDRTLVPVRGVFEQMGFVVSWNSEYRQAILASDLYTVVLSIDSQHFTINDTLYILDVPAQIIGDSTMIPLRAVMEGVGYTLNWQQGAIAITSPISQIPEYITIRGQVFSTDLTYLSLVGRGLTNACIHPLRYMRQLEELNLGFNPAITDISPLTGITSITKLILSMSQITDISPLATLPYLNWMHFDNSPLTDISPLAGHIYLEQLIMFNNQIADISPLAGLTNLHRLVLADNEIEDITPLEGLTNLRVLGLSRNKITDISVLAGLYNLHEISLNGNEIADFSPLGGLEYLQSIYTDYPDTDIEGEYR